jgi:hypothetical protein
LNAPSNTVLTKYHIITVDPTTSAYLYAKCDMDVYTRLGDEFAIFDESIKPGTLARVYKALYGLPTSANRWHAHLADHLRQMGFKPTRYDPDVWIKYRDETRQDLDYIGTHTDDLMIVAKDAMQYMKCLQETFTIKKVAPPEFHLGCDYKRCPVTDHWMIGTKTYVKEALEKVKELLFLKDDNQGRNSLGLEGTPMKANYQPEMDDTEFLSLAKHREYQKLIGMAQWLITCGRMDISFAVSSLSRFSAAPRQGHYNAAVNIFKFLNHYPEKWIIINPADLVFPAETTRKYQGAEWKDQYSDAEEELDPKFPRAPNMKPLSTTIFYDSNFAHDEKTRRSITGIMGFVGSMPVLWLSKRQGAIATSTYSAEMCAAKVACEEAVGLRYMLRSLGVPIPRGTAPTILLGDNQGQLDSVTNPGAFCKKKHSHVAYHYIRECEACGIVESRKIGKASNVSCEMHLDRLPLLTILVLDTKYNASDPFTKALDKSLFSNHFGYIFNPMDKVARRRMGRKQRVKRRL